MKYFYILLFTLPLLAHTYPLAAGAQPIPFDEATDGGGGGGDGDGDSDSAESAQISKRSGSGSSDYVTHFKGGLLSSLGQASASIASGSSGGSTNSGYTYKANDGHGHHGNSLSYDPWSVKKAVLNTIFQAVKAITGGVTALKGQLIKGSGYALRASGQVVASSGDKVTNVGKYIINSATSNLHPIPSSGSGGGGGGGSGIGTFAHLSGSSSGLNGHSDGDSGDKHVSGPVVHTETITTYEIPSGGHPHYGPPSKPPTYSSATHHYLPPPSAGFSGGGGGVAYGGGHAAFEAPSGSYLPSGYGHEAIHTGRGDFNYYGRYNKLTDAEARKAAVQLQEILNMLPSGKTEYTASKTVTLDTSAQNGDTMAHGEHVDLQTYGVPNNLGALESLSHTESITAAYATQPQVLHNAADVYHEMARKPTAEETYLQKHPDEALDYKYNNNFHGPHGGQPDNALQDITPILAALEVAKRRPPASSTVNYSVEKNVHKVRPTASVSVSASVPPSSPPSEPSAYYMPPIVQKSKYIYYNPPEENNNSPPYNGPYKVRRHVRPKRQQELSTRRVGSLFGAHDFDQQDSLLYNRMMNF